MQVQVFSMTQSCHLSNRCNTFPVSCFFSQWSQGTVEFV